MKPGLFAKRRRTHACRLEVLEARLVLSTLPVVSTGAAVDVTSTGATILGTVNPGGAATNSYFQYSAGPWLAPTEMTRLVTGVANPSWLTVDAAGHLYVSDATDGSLKEIFSDGTIATLVTGSPTSAVAGVAADAAGNVVFADFLEGSVKEFLHNGTVRTVKTGFDGPTGVARDAAGNIYVTEPRVPRITKILPDGQVETMGAGFSTPTAIGVDPAGNVYVADVNAQMVLKIPADGTTIDTIASGLDRPTGLAVDAAGTVYVSDGGSHQLIAYPPGGTSFRVAQGVNFPKQPAVDAAGNLYTSDGQNGRIFQFNIPALIAEPNPANGTSTVAVASTLSLLQPRTQYAYRLVAVNDSGLALDAGPAHTFTTTAPPLDKTPPRVVALTRLGRAAVVAKFSEALDPARAEIESNYKLVGPGGGRVGVRLARYDANAQHVVLRLRRRLAPRSNYTLTIDGNGHDGLIDNAGNPLDGDRDGQAGGNFKAKVLATASNAPPAVDTGAATDVSPTGATLRGTVDPNGKTTRAWFEYSTDPNFATYSQVTTIETRDKSLPTAVATDAAGNLYMSYGLSKIIKRTADGKRTTIGPKFFELAGMAPDTAGNLYVVDVNDIKKIAPDGEVSTVPVELSAPRSIAVDAAGNLYVTDNQKIKWVAPNGKVTIIDGVIREPQPNGPSKIVDPGFGQLLGIAVDAAGNIYVSDAGNRAIKKVDGSDPTDPKKITTLVKDIAALSLAVDRQGYLYAADRGNVYRIAPDGGVKTLYSGFQSSTVAVGGDGAIYTNKVIYPTETRGGEGSFVAVSVPRAEPFPSPLGGTNNSPVAITLTNLVPGATYYFRLVAYNGETLVIDQSPLRSFTTAPQSANRASRKR